MLWLQLVNVWTPVSELLSLMLCRWLQCVCQPSRSSPLWSGSPAEWTSPPLPPVSSGSSHPGPCGGWLYHGQRSGKALKFYKNIWIRLATCWWTNLLRLYFFFPIQQSMFEFCTINHFVTAIIFALELKLDHCNLSNIAKQSFWGMWMMVTLESTLVQFISQSNSWIKCVLLFVTEAAFTISIAADSHFVSFWTNGTVNCVESISQCRSPHNLFMGVTGWSSRQLRLLATQRSKRFAFT